MTVICISRQEIDRVSVLRHLDQRRITVAQAATRMHLTRRPGPRGTARHEVQPAWGPLALVV
jgi:hypothetical protein